MTHIPDEKDHQILDILKDHADYTTRQIAKKTLLPITTIHNRIKKLKAEGIIKKFTVKLNYEKLDQNFRAYVLISANLQILKEKRQVIPCFAGTFTLVVDASGYVYFCELLPALGNIREKSLSQIFSSPEARKQRASIKNSRCYCVHSCFQGKNLYLNYKLYPRFLVYLFRNCRP